MPTGWYISRTMTDARFARFTCKQTSHGTSVSDKQAGHRRTAVHIGQITLNYRRRLNIAPANPAPTSSSVAGSGIAVNMSLWKYGAA